MNRYVYSSVTRIADLNRPWQLEAIPQESWGSGDYVVGKVIDPRALHNVELPTGRIMEVMAGDLVVGAWGSRAATLEAVGDWESIEDNTFDAMTPAGLFGQITSSSSFLPSLMRLEYKGHVVRDGRKFTMSDAVTPPAAAASDAPVVLIVGTSMSAGKTTSGRLITHLLSQAGKRIVGAKLTGAARYRDVLSFQDAGAEWCVRFRRRRFAVDRLRAGGIPRCTRDAVGTDRRGRSRCHRCRSRCVSARTVQRRHRYRYTRRSHQVHRFVRPGSLCRVRRAAGVSVRPRRRGRWCSEYQRGCRVGQETHRFATDESPRPRHSRHTRSNAALGIKLNCE